jgi:DNA-binding winged helix-turn-helix (wHTH) protein
MKTISELKTMCEETRSKQEILNSEIAVRVTEVRKLLKEVGQISTLAGIGIDLDDIIQEIDSLPNYEGESWFSSTRC